LGEGNHIQMEEKKKKWKNEVKIFLVGLIFVILSMSLIFAADPVYPDQVDFGNNETKAATSSLSVNVSGGYVSNFNLTANVQNQRWKAFVGQVIGQFTLDDSGGSTIYDWTLSTVTGRVYATRKSAAVTWTGIDCASVAQMEAENTALSLTNIDDNITATFDDTTHAAFPVGPESITGNSCPTLNTYRNGVKTQDAGQDFEEMVLYETGGDLVYATIMEDDATGYDNQDYDFQMIVPENGSVSFTGNTLYYLYIELGN
jgi:hypothetical protein